MRLMFHSQRNDKLYPICHELSQFRTFLLGRVDRLQQAVHFWDPMMNRVNSTAARALNSAAMSHAAATMMIITMTTTTRMRGAYG